MRSLFDLINHFFQNNKQIYDCFIHMFSIQKQQSLVDTTDIESIKIINSYSMPQTLLTIEWSVRTNILKKSKSFTVEVKELYNKLL